MSVLTSLTAQNTCGVSGIHVPPVDFFRSQLKAIWEDVDVDAIKVGMLGNRDVIMALSEELQTHAMNGEQVQQNAHELYLIHTMQQYQLFLIQSWYPHQALCS